MVKGFIVNLAQMSGITVPTFWRASLARRVWLAGRCTRRSARLCNRPVIQPRPDLTSVGGVGGTGILQLMYRYAGTQQAQKSRPVAARLQVTSYKLREAARLKVKRSAFCPVWNANRDSFQNANQGDHVVRLALLLNADVYAVLKQL